MIANSGHDERGNYIGGKAGDQTGTEWEIRSWYARPWNVVLRYPDAAVREAIATAAEQAAHNDYIGYDQGNRLSFYRALSEVEWDPSMIRVPCESDCSAGATACVIAAGHKCGNEKLSRLSPSIYTGNARQCYKAAGFNVLGGPEYTGSPDRLLRGDVLLLEGGHMAVNLSNGNKTAAPASGNAPSTGAAHSGTLPRRIKWIGRVTSDGLNIRTWAGAEHPTIKKRGPLGRGNTVGVCAEVTAEDGSLWYYVYIADADCYGFVSARHIEKC